MSDLISNLGDILQANNHIFNRKTVQVYVENEEDVAFWQYFFTKKSMKTNISAATKAVLGNGKSVVMSFENQTNAAFVLCVDSDNDYMMQGETAVSRRVIENPYIFETYVHSMESYRCYAKYLHNIVGDAVLVTDKIFDFEIFLQQYSEIIYELFIKFVYFEKIHQLEFEVYKQKKAVLSAEDFLVWRAQYIFIAHIFSQNSNFCPAIKILTPIKIADNGQAALADLKIKVDTAYANLPTVSQQDLDTIKTDLATLGITPQNTYLFIQGHTLYDNIVKPILNTVADNLKSKKMAEFATTAKDDEHTEQQRNEYKKIVLKAKNAEWSAVERTWFNAKYYEFCPFASKIEADIKRYIALS